jgi:SAM-dependent methyltransferase
MIGLPDLPLACPVDHSGLTVDGSTLWCADGHRYPVVDGVPVLLRDDVPETLWVHRRSLAAAWEHVNGKRTDERFLETLAIADGPRETLRAALSDPAAVDPVVSHMLVATNGRLYRPLLGRITRYPIPEMPLARTSGLLLDIGCGWGRWSLAAAIAGFDVVGIDPSLGAVLTARRVAQQLGLGAAFLVADGRSLPFPDGAFTTVFSYSVLQHFAAESVDGTLAEVRRVLEPGGRSCIQMANAYGLRSLLVQAGRRFREPERFEVRYWSPGALVRWFERTIGPSRMSVDGFFGLGVRPEDRDLLPHRYRAIIGASDVLRGLAARLPLLGRGADSLFVHSERAA